MTTTKRFQQLYKKNLRIGFGTEKIAGISSPHDGCNGQWF